MAMSTAAVQAPNRPSASASAQGVGASARQGISAQNTSPAASITTRGPRACTSGPASGSAISPPIPSASSSVPRLPSSSPSRALACGTSGAHTAMPMPIIRNTTRVVKPIAGAAAAPDEKSPPCGGPFTSASFGKAQALAIAFCRFSSILARKAWVFSQG
jgi:hypothetical protein